MCSASDYFVKALNGKFKEATDYTLRLPGCDEDALRFFVYYLTHGKTLLEFDETCGELAGSWDERDSDASQFARKHILILMHVWKFADVTLMPKLQNVAIKWICKLMSWIKLDVDLVRVAFADTAEDSHLRKAMVGEVIGEWQLEYLLPTVPKQARIMDGLGSIPGFFPLFCKLLPLWMEPKAGEDTLAPSAEGNWENYMVEEGA